MKEVIGKPWTYSKDTKKKLAEDKGQLSHFEAKEMREQMKALQADIFEPSQQNVMYPKTRRNLQPVNGRRVSKTTAKVNQ